MSDEDDFREAMSHVQFMAPGPDGQARMWTPFEYADAVNAARDKAKGEEDVQSHRWENFIDSLDNEQLEQLGEGIIASLQDGRFAYRTLGRIEQLKSTKYKICAACDKDHDAELHKMIIPEGYTVEKIEPVLRTEPVDPLPEKMTNAELMDLYRVVPNTTGETLLKCRDCGMEYQSLADRMIKEPDECEGCVLKTKWG